MALNDDVAADVNSGINTTWSLRDGQVVPATDDVALAGGGVRLQATMLYADLADSTVLASTHDRRVVAKVYKAFLSSSSRIIRAEGGYIRSFDGDRVMGVFLGKSKNTSAARSALKINYAFTEILRPKLQAAYKVFADGTFELAHAVGVDTGDVLVVRAGIRNNNDLVWVGRCANVAAKLCSIRESPYHSFITEDVYSVLADEAKFGGKTKSLMWEPRTLPSYSNMRIHRSSWWWRL